VSQQSVTLTVVIRNKYGLHARPAALFVEMCNRFESEVEVLKDSLTVNGKNILDIMMLGAEEGVELILNINGTDAETAAEHLRNLIDTNFGEN
jgi:phosphocarrier protein